MSHSPSSVQQRSPLSRAGRWTATFCGDLVLMAIGLVYFASAGIAGVFGLVAWMCAGAIDGIDRRRQGWLKDDATRQR